MQTKDKTTEKYKKPNLGVMFQRVSEFFKLDPKLVRGFIQREFPEVFKKECCANCGASMAIYEHSIDQIDALLLLGMGKIVERRAKTMPFHLANQVHIQSELNKYYSVQSRTTWCSKLGLIAKVKHPNGRHNQKAGWCITKRGFELLAGKPVPRKVQTFRNKIVARFDEKITLRQVVAGITDNNEVKQELSTYTDHKFDELENWAVVGFAQGVLLK
jgi:hypothetical protein